MKKKGGGEGRNVRAQSKRNRRRGRKVAKRSTLNDETILLKQKLDEKFGNANSGGRTVEDKAPYIAENLKDGKFAIWNGSRHNQIIERMKESVINKSSQSDYANECIVTKWRCALCQQRTLQSILGDLYGPYYVKLNDKTSWPNFLAKRPGKFDKDKPYWCDLWLHGYCALYTPELHLCGSEFPALDDNIDRYWSQHCVVCSREGATVTIKNSLYHYPCAYSKNLIDESY